jgi:hypothetical protein
VAKALYSVPGELIGRRLDAGMDARTVKLYWRGERSGRRMSTLRTAWRPRDALVTTLPLPMAGWTTTREKGA